MGSTITYGNVDFVVKNDTKTDPSFESVRSAGKISLKLEVSDIGDKVGRRLQAFVAVYERADTKTLKRGKLVKEYLDPKTLTSLEVGIAISTLDTTFPVGKGDYIVKVFLCDPDMPADQSRTKPPVSNPVALPGHARMMRSFIAHVD